MADESSTLLGGSPASVYNTKPKKNGSLKTFVYRIYHALLVALVIYLAFYKNKQEKTPQVDTKKKKNVIFMVTDGMGPASLSLTRSFRQFRDNLDIGDVLTLDKYLIGSSRTRSNSSLITDSAAGATAFSCALKTYNEAIGVDSLQQPCGTILEALKLEGYLTGLVVTTRITDATPGAFSSHVDFRSQEDLIAQHQIGEYPLGRMVDLIIGGGRCHYYPRGISGGCRNDDRNLIEEVKEQGSWSYAGNRKEFDLLDNGKNVSLPLLALLADGDIPYDLDRDSEVYPSIAEQVKVALTSLSKATENSDQGFFLLIEGSRIDHAGHHNDPAAQVREVLAYDKAFEEVVKFIDESDVETVAISTSDHETGGLVTSRQISSNYPDYLWYPEVLLNSTHSGEYLSNKIIQNLAKDLKVLEKFIVNEIIKKDMGISDYTPEEVKSIIELSNNKSDLLYFLNNMISVRSQTGWTTHGHSAVDVNIYAYSNSEAINARLRSTKENYGLSGNHENTEIGKFMEAITGVDLGKITELIKDTKHSRSENFEAKVNDGYHEHN